MFIFSCVRSAHTCVILIVALSNFTYFWDCCIQWFYFCIHLWSAHICITLIVALSNLMYLWNSYRTRFLHVVMFISLVCMGAKRTCMRFSDRGITKFLVRFLARHIVYICLQLLNQYVWPFYYFLYFLRHIIIHCIQYTDRCCYKIIYSLLFNSKLTLCY